MRKIHIDIYFNWQIILEKSLFPIDEYFIDPDAETSSPQISGRRNNFLLI